MSTAAEPRTSFVARIDSLATFFTSDRVVAVRHVIREAWWNLRPAVVFALRVAALTLLLGLSHWADFDSLRADIAAADTSRPTLLAVFDAFDSVLNAAAAVGSSMTAANVALWLAWAAAAAAVVLTAVSIAVSPASSAAPPLTRSMARFPRLLLREVVVVLIACAILARAVGEPDYLFNTYMWMNVGFLAVVSGLTVLAEQRWMATTSSFIAAANLPIGAAVAGAAGGSTVTVDPTNDFHGAITGMGGQVINLGHSGGLLDPLAGGVAGRGAVDPEENR